MMVRGFSRTISYQICICIRLKLFFKLKKYDSNMIRVTEYTRKT